MKLIDLVENIENIDREAIIFQENLANLSSDIIVSSANEGDSGEKEEMGRRFYYLIEVFLAKEFIVDWLATLDYEPTLEAITQRLYYYAINDA